MTIFRRPPRIVARPFPVAALSVAAAASADGVGASSGAATAAAVGSALSAAVATSAGIATATAAAEGAAQGVGASSGAATVAAVGTSLGRGAGAAACAGTPTGVGAALGAGVGFASLVRRALRFYGDNTADVDRVRIPLTASAGTVATTANVGAGNFTVEFWMRCAYADNATTSTTDWRFSNVIFDRDIWNDERGHGLGVARSGADLVLVFGVAGASLNHLPITGTTHVGDGAWHHIAIDRNASTGLIRLFADGVLEGSRTYTTGSLAYPTSYTPSGGQDNEYIVLAQEKHDLESDFNGSLTGLRLSTVRRYTGSSFTPATAPFTPDSDTAALYLMDAESGTTLFDRATLSGSPTNGALLQGGTNNGPQWLDATPFPLVAGVGNATTVAAGAGASSGVAAAAAIGASQAASAGTAAGVGAATAAGIATATAAASSSGAGTAAGVGTSTAASVGAGAGAAAPASVGASLATAVGASAGVATASAVGGAVTEGSGVGEATGSSTATGAGASLSAGAGSAAGVGSSLGVGASLWAATGAAAGTSSALVSAGWVAVGGAAGSATVTGVGGSRCAAVGNAAGAATATGVAGGYTPGGRRQVREAAVALRARETGQRVRSREVRE